jgi:hypothetical protein
MKKLTGFDRGVAFATPLYFWGSCRVFLPREIRYALQFATQAAANFGVIATAGRR